jgi:hypothetical protein
MWRLGSPGTLKNTLLPITRVLSRAARRRKRQSRVSVMMMAKEKGKARYVVVNMWGRK